MIKLAKSNKKDLICRKLACFKEVIQLQSEFRLTISGGCARCDVRSRRGLHMCIRDSHMHFRNELLSFQLQRTSSSLGHASQSIVRTGSQDGFWCRHDKLHVALQG